MRLFSAGNVGFAKRNIMFVRQINGTQFDLEIERRSLEEPARLRIRSWAGIF